MNQVFCICQMNFVTNDINVIYHVNRTWRVLSKAVLDYFIHFHVCFMKTTSCTREFKTRNRR
jgi:hypothetical protein